MEQVTIGASTGKHTTAEGFRIINMDRDDVEGALEMCARPLVAMPQTWTGGRGRVDTFTAQNFLRLLDSRTLAES